MNERIDQIKKAIEPLRQQIIHHKVYAAIKDVEDLNIFMQYHVFAVWDFMSLLKALQNHLTCTSVPWFPKGNGDISYLINEIVTGEESDVDSMGNRKSHFELYLDAMQQSGADLTAINQFIAALKQSGDLNTAFHACTAPDEVRRFVSFTFDVINSQNASLQAAVFTFGREDLIPGMFVAMVNDLYKHFPNNIAVFKYYLERHIEVDGDHHSNLALQMTASLCGNNEQYWQEAEEATIEALRKRMELWDGAYEQICKRRNLHNGTVLQDAKIAATVTK